jgi:hypothetical protein
MAKATDDLPELLSSNGAMGQEVSMISLAFAWAGYTGDLGPATQALADNPEQCLRKAAPQALANILWSLGRLCGLSHDTHSQADAQPGAYNEGLFSYLIQQLSHCVQATGQELTPQQVSNAIYGCAVAGHVEGVPQLLDAVCQRLDVMVKAAPQEWSNSIWAVATLQKAAEEREDTQLAEQLQGYGHKLLAMCASALGALQGGSPQHLSNILWAASVLGWYD